MNQRISAVGVVLAIALSLAASPALAAVDMFIKIGDIKGESADKSHKDEIDVLSWSWGMSQSGSFHVGGGGGSGKVNIQDLSFTKWVDKSTPNLMMACSKGTHIPDATVVVRKAGDSPLEYITLEMKKVMVTSVSTGGSGGEDRLTENVTLNFAHCQLTYKGQDDAGASTGATPGASMAAPGTPLAGASMAGPPPHAAVAPAATTTKTASITTTAAPKSTAQRQPNSSRETPGSKAPAIAQPTRIGTRMKAAT